MHVRPTDDPERPPILTLVLVATWLLVSAGGVPAATVSADYYVDKTSPQCSDNGSGKQAAPFCTITKGVSQLVPGSTVFVGNGTYRETVKPTVSGSAGSPVTITAWPGRDPVIGDGVTNGAYLSTRSYITMSNLTFDGTTDDSIYVSKSDHIVLSGNTVARAGQPVSGKTARGFYVKGNDRLEDHREHDLEGDGRRDLSHHRFHQRDGGATTTRASTPRRTHGPVWASG